MLSTVSARRRPGRFLYASRDGFASELTSLLGRECVHTFLTADFATKRSLLYEEIPNILW
jgi:hypothetical protein